MRQNNHPNIQFFQQSHFDIFPHYNFVLNVWHLTDKWKMYT